MEYNIDRCHVGFLSQHYGVFGIYQIVFLAMIFVHVTYEFHNMKTLLVFDYQKLNYFHNDVTQMSSRKLANGQIQKEEKCIGETTVKF